MCKSLLDVFLMCITLLNLLFFPFLGSLLFFLFLGCTVSPSYWIAREFPLLYFQEKEIIPLDPLGWIPVCLLGIYIFVCVNCPIDLSIFIGILVFFFIC